VHVRHDVGVFQVGEGETVPLDKERRAA
jgi:hypothetical protein